MLKLVSDNPFPRPDLHDSISEHWQEQEAHDYGFLLCSEQPVSSSEPCSHRL
jgi:hypothetical protein